MRGIRHRLGVMVPGNNSTLEPEMWRVLPPEAGLYASRLMLKGDVTVDNLKSMESEIDRAGAELMATGVDVMMIADMVVSFIMEPGWNERRCEGLTTKWGVPVVTGWTALRAARNTAAPLTLAGQPASHTQLAIGLTAVALIPARRPKIVLSTFEFDRADYGGPALAGCRSLRARLLTPIRRGTRRALSA